MLRLACCSVALIMVQVSCSERPPVDPVQDGGVTDRNVLPLPPTPDLHGVPPAPQPDLAPLPQPDLSHPVPVDAAPLPPGCKPYNQGMPSSCKGKATWTKYVTSACTQMGLPVVLNLTFLEPCGPGLFRGVSAACCPASDGP